VKRESLKVRLDEMEQRFERRLRRIQWLSIAAIALIASAVFAQRGLTQQAPADGTFGVLTARRLMVGTVVVTSQLGNDPCGSDPDNICLSGSHIWSSTVEGAKVVATHVNSDDSRTGKLVVSSGDGKEAGGIWFAAGRSSTLVLFDSQGQGRFTANTGSDPVLSVTPYSGKPVTVPVP
jgi:hypothetical protein